MPESRKQKSDDDDPFGKGRDVEEFEDGKQVRNAGNRQWNEKRWCAEAAELARAYRERHEHDCAKNVESAGWSEPHKSPREGLSCSTACLHCANQAAVRGALDGKTRSSSASRVRSAATSMS